MILEGFEIKNWSCIRELRVANLPPQGVVVIGGPNRRGKSSIVRALRACLMDYPSSSKSQKVTDCYPRGSGEKPIVSVTFRAGGQTYRIEKFFGTNKSEFASKTPTGAWKVETTSSAEAHERTRGLAGGGDSSRGLHQLLWLTQAEFRLPDAREFDTGVQSQLRGLLGVLQTPLDDRFIERIKEHWKVWFSGQRKPDKEIKASCALAEKLARLEADRTELRDSESKFLEVEGLLRQAGELETGRRDLERQHGDRSGDLSDLQKEQRECQERVKARQLAEKDYATCEKERNEALAERQQRSEAATRFRDDDAAIEPVRAKLMEAEGKVQAKVEKQTHRRDLLAMRREARRILKDDSNLLASKLRTLEHAAQLTAAEGFLARAQEVANEIETIEHYLSQNPVPDKAAMEALKENRIRVARLQADCAAASMSMRLAPEPGAGTTRLALDDSPLQTLAVPNQPAVHSVRRKAELHIDGWGQIEFNRGSATGNLDQIEDELRKCSIEFADAVAVYGIAATASGALDQLIQRDAEYRQKTLDLAKQQRELKKLAPKGLKPLQAAALELRAKVNPGGVADPAENDSIPAYRTELEARKAELEVQVGSLDDEIEQIERDDAAFETEIDEARRAETSLKASLEGCSATAKSSRGELGRLRREELINQRVSDSELALAEADKRLGKTELTERERNIDKRVEAAAEAVAALVSQIREIADKYNRIKGRLEESEGLHAKRSAIAARVEELTRQTERESLEKDAVDRLYALFEECREKQLGTLMTPIHDRVLNWMRVLDIGDYRELRFNDAFLPDKLLTRDGTAEFAVGEESTGAQEQIGMLVRLALGSVLSRPDEPVVAVLDDPLTHCDIGRLSRMRVILRRAAEGDPMLVPAAGPLQIVVFTCHPEWFRDDRATVIDLEDAEIMTRFVH